MNRATLDILRCPYCGGRLSLVDSLFHRASGDDIHDGILGCHCCIFPVVDGIPVLHLQAPAPAARDHVQAGKPELARRVMFGLEDGPLSEAFDAVAASPASTYRDIVDALGPTFEGGYFLYRFSDPTYIVAQAVVRATAAAVLGGTRRAIDLCGGSGHVTRSLLGLSSPPPVLADLYFAKVWLARRFTAPGCEPVCVDGNAPLPFARGAFGLAMCTDAFMFIWTKRQFVGEMARLIDGQQIPGAVLIGHTHNERVWSPSHGNPLTPEAYADLFETLEPRLFAEGGLFEDVIGGGPLDLSRRDSADALDRDPAVTIIATRHPGVFAPHALPPLAPAIGEFRINPLYALEDGDGGAGDDVRLRLRFPSDDYEQEYGACRQYLPDEVTVARSVLDALPARVADGPLADLARRRIVLDLPARYY
ncbi:MAG: hypothetical protein LAO77_01465 [Acidobacteriia bacterium]|nr:hypothetical protein [Terriglobia bacterium]